MSSNLPPGYCDETHSWRGFAAGNVQPLNLPKPMRTTPKTYTTESDREAWLILDDARANNLDGEALAMACDMAAQKLRPVAAPNHDVKALAKLTDAQLEQQASSVEPGSDAHYDAIMECCNRGMTGAEDDEALEQLAQKYPIELPWMKEGMGCKKVTGDFFCSLIDGHTGYCAVRPLAQQPACAVPPAGWACSRSAGHEGPCAASPIIAAGTPSDGGRPNCLNSDCAGCEKGGEGV